jgi:hypothetical protein
VCRQTRPTTSGAQFNSRAQRQARCSRPGEGGLRGREQHPAGKPRQFLFPARARWLDVTRDMPDSLRIRRDQALVQRPMMILAEGEPVRRVIIPDEIEIAPRSVPQCVTPRDVVRSGNPEGQQVKNDQQQHGFVRTFMARATSADDARA